MNRKLGRLIQPGMGMYFAVMGLFCVAAMAADRPGLAVAELIATAGMFALYQMNNNRRRKELTAFVPVSSAPTEVVIIEEIIEEQPKRHHDRDRHHDHGKHHKQDKHERKVVVFNEWDGVIIDMGAANEGECPNSCK